MSAAQRRHLVPIEDVIAGLNARIQDVALELLPGGFREGSQWRCGGLGGGAGRSLGLDLRGSKVGVWVDSATGECGDVLDLVARTICRGDKREALAWAKQFLGWDSGDTHRVEIERRKAQAQAQATRLDDAERAQKLAKYAQALWLEGSAKVVGTPVEAYLGGRGIDLGRLERVPGAVRFHPSLLHKESGERWPAMVTAITAPDGRFMAVHRTFLSQRADGSVTKAPVDNAKMALGAYAGGCIRLTRGASGRRWAEMREGERLGLAEGIENALSIAVDCPDLRTAACVALGNLARLVLPPQVTEVIHFADRPGCVGELRHLQQGLAKLRAEGRLVRVAWAPRDAAPKDPAP
ncbi:DUF7146 domain-containing protein [Zavarzinia sp. CC-PAN008]|uniref:DUF7146 domain-containing protein n=1 Tax=Zavarzinia sp. CC-PAN008 TaxID=3243332 RepID=UPI003F7485F8